MSHKIPSWAIAQALSEWRAAVPESGYRQEIDQQLHDRAREILARPPPISVLAEVSAERKRQDARWGVQNHPDLPPDVQFNHPCGYFELPLADMARAECELAFKQCRGSYAHIFVEEVCEAIEAGRDPASLRAELVQVAAVAVAWIECIDRRAATGTGHAP